MTFFVAIRCRGNGVVESPRKIDPNGPEPSLPEIDSPLPAIPDAAERKAERRGELEISCADAQVVLSVPVLKGGLEGASYAR